MKKCVRIVFSANIPVNFLHISVKKFANELAIEGSARIIPANQKIELLACGRKSEIDSFVDILHRELSKANIYEMEVEPFIKLKDYRGVFRVIE